VLLLRSLQRTAQGRGRIVLSDALKDRVAEHLAGLHPRPACGFELPVGLNLAERSQQLPCRDRGYGALADLGTSP